MTKRQILPPAREAFVVAPLIKDLFDPKQSNYTAVAIKTKEIARFSWPAFCTLGAAVSTAFKDPEPQIRHNASNVMEVLFKKEGETITGKRQKILLQLAQEFSSLCFSQCLVEPKTLVEERVAQANSSSQLTCTNSLFNKVKDPEIRDVFKYAIQVFAQCSAYPDIGERAQDRLTEIKAKQAQAIPA